MIAYVIKKSLFLFENRALLITDGFGNFLIFYILICDFIMLKACLKVLIYLSWIYPADNISLIEKVIIRKITSRRCKPKIISKNLKRESELLKLKQNKPKKFALEISLNFCLSFEPLSVVLG